LPDSSSTWWRRDVHADRRPFLLARNRITKAFRAWFEAEGFEEVEAAALQVSPGNEAHLHAFATQALTISGEASPLYLHTSPEFACKKLLAAGEEKIFSLSKVWRNRERGPLHHPEFTMLEWYRAGAPYQILMDDCATLLALAAETAGTKRFEFRGMACDPFAEPERLSVAEAFDRHADDDAWADVFSRIIVEKVEPRLGEGRATVLCEYPISEAALARPKDADPRVAERFELYACGVELANAFGELTDPAEQRRRFMIEMDEKARIYGERYPIDEDFLAALEHMPEASGSALGFDRLVLLATGARRIADVVWTPVAEG
jgi:lysyl-tRNA synthetase class 2